MFKFHSTLSNSRNEHVTTNLIGTQRIYDVTAGSYELRYTVAINNRLYFINKSEYERNFRHSRVGVTYATRGFGLWYGIHEALKQYPCL
jgi:hypothetical protein